MTTLLAAIKRRPELSQEHAALRTAWDRLEEEVRSFAPQVVFLPWKTAPVGSPPKPLSG